MKTQVSTPLIGNAILSLAILFSLIMFFFESSSYNMINSLLKGSTYISYADIAVWDIKTSMDGYVKYYFLKTLKESPESFSLADIKSSYSRFVGDFYRWLNGKKVDDITYEVKQLPEMENVNVISVPGFKIIIPESRIDGIVMLKTDTEMFSINVINNLPTTLPVPEDTLEKSFTVRDSFLLEASQTFVNMGDYLVVDGGVCTEKEPYSDIKRGNKGDNCIEEFSQQFNKKLSDCSVEILFAPEEPVCYYPASMVYESKRLERAVIKCEGGSIKGIGYVENVGATQVLIKPIELLPENVSGIRVDYEGMVYYIPILPEGERCSEEKTEKILTSWCGYSCEYDPVRGEKVYKCRGCRSDPPFCKEFFEGKKC